MTLFELSTTAITGVPTVGFETVGLKERGDLQRLLRDHVGVISPDTLVISEEFSSWDRSDRRIDILGVDRQARLVVIELKRTVDDGFAELQALRYAGMVSKMTFEEAVDAYARYLKQRQQDVDARSSLLEFLTWDDPSDGRFGSDLRIVLAAAGFSQEVTSTVLWLNEHDLDITCVRIQPYRVADSILIDVQQLIPLPEAADYQIQIRQKQRETRAAAEQSADWTRYDLVTGDKEHRALFKRDVVFEATRFLIQRGVRPDEIETAAGRRIFEVVDGQVDGAAFRAELALRRPNDTYIDRRYFTRDDQLISVGGKTYAITKGWSKATMESAMVALIEKWGQLGLSYSVSGGVGAKTI